jgi:hypothetical protein
MLTPEWSEHIPYAGWSAPFMTLYDYDAFSEADRVLSFSVEPLSA